MSDITGYICGARGTRPVSGPEFTEFGGDTTCYVIKRDRHAVVLDCGSGLSQARTLFRDCDRIDVLLTHLHYDHILGLLDWGVFPSNIRPTFYSTFPESWLRNFLTPPFWPVGPGEARMVQVRNGENMDLGDGFRAWFLPANHPDGSSILRLETAGGTLCFLCDFEHGQRLPEGFLDGCGLLVYDGTYTEEEYPAHAGWGHSTWQEGCRLAGEAGISQLLITHHEPSCTDCQLREREEQARHYFPAVRFARDGDQFTL